jgi:IS5 family transposase
LLQISNLIDWSPIRQILDEMYDNKSEKGGRPNCDVILMFKILILQQWYGLSDLEVERQMADRISFMAFLGFPDLFPDSRTIWLFKERMGKTEKDKIVWAELQRQLDSMGLQVRRGTIQDATFIEADQGSLKKPRGDAAKTRRSRDGTIAKKGNEYHFGYKLHQKVCVWLHLFVSLMLISSMKAQRLTTLPKSKTNIYCRCSLEFAFRNWPCKISRNRFIDAD